MHGNFLTLPGFSGRAHKMNVTGIQTDQLTAADKGNYSVEVLLRTAGGDIVALWRSVSVHVAGRCHG